MYVAEADGVPEYNGTITSEKRLVAVKFLCHDASAKERYIMYALLFIIFDYYLNNIEKVPWFYMTWNIAYKYGGRFIFLLDKLNVYKLYPCLYLSAERNQLKTVPSCTQICGYTRIFNRVQRYFFFYLSSNSYINIMSYRIKVLNRPLNDID